MRWILLALIAAVAALAGLRLWTLADTRAANEAWRALIRTAPADPPRFDPAAIADLPEPARRFLNATIRPGTPLRTVAEVRMRGELGLGTKADPGYRPMRACQILASPEGYAWQVSTGTWPVGLTGSDGAFAGDSWTRFRLAGLVPVARLGGNPDHLRSSFGRYVADASFWTPAALMPSDAVRWEATGPDSARATVTHGNLVQGIDLTLDAAGLPRTVAFERWSDENPDKVYRLQRFGGELSDFREFDGFTVPTRVEAGNHHGTDAYFPFFKAVVEGVRYVDSPEASRGCPLPWRIHQEHGARPGCPVRPSRRRFGERLGSDVPDAPAPRGDGTETTASGSPRGRPRARGRGSSARSERPGPPARRSSRPHQEPGHRSALDVAPPGVRHERRRVVVRRSWSRGWGRAECVGGSDIEHRDPPYLERMDGNDVAVRPANGPGDADHVRAPVSRRGARTCSFAAGAL